MKHPAFACLGLASLALLCSWAPVSRAAPTCQARSGPAAPLVLELYTSEGCSSCPPADRWFSSLKGRNDVLPLAFHVRYWDHLGWPDRFASVEGTARQRMLAQAAGQRGVYTPQVLAGGHDWRRWPQLPRPAADSPVQLQLVREADTVTVQVSPAKAGAPRLSGYWAVLEDGHHSAVRAGENAGETLRHDHVVRLYRPVPAWTVTAGHRAELQVSRGTSEFPRRVVFVVTDADTLRPLQALALGC